MKIFVRTFLVLICVFSVVATPVQAGDVLGPGDIAIIGFNSDDTSQFAFVCLKEISDGTIVYFTDNGWMYTDTFRSGEGRLTWETPGGCALGQIVTINQFDLTTLGSFQLANSGDQILVYQGSDSIPNFIFGINFEGTDWQLNASSANTSDIPTGLDSTNSIALTEIDNAIYVGPRTFDTPSEALAAIVNQANWSGSDDVRQTMPSGSFSFTTTAVHLSDFNAETGSESIPLWGFIILLVAPVAFFTLKRPKRDCCK